MTSIYSVYTSRPTCRKWDDMRTRMIYESELSLQMTSWQQEAYGKERIPLRA